MPVRTMSSQSHTRRVESEELYKELLQGIDISAFFTTHITPDLDQAKIKADI